MRKTELIGRIKETTKKNRLTHNAYNKLKIIAKGSDFSVKQISTAIPVAEDNSTPRINIVLPTLRSSMVFGGISTALNAFLQISKGYDKRIIVTGNEGYDSKLTYQVQEFSRKEGTNTILFLGENNSVPIRKKDIFLVTSWMTAYTITSLFNWQVQYYKNDKLKILYFIQDFEPGFLPWSSEYLIADSTYRTNAYRTIAIFNSEELHTYFNHNGYEFFDEVHFRPNINKNLKRYLENSGESSNREKKILVYGRISSSRNAFGLLMDSLEYWSKTYDKSNEWKIISLGEEHPNIHLHKNVVHSKGKLSLEEYGREMLSSYAGVSLMASPHPSYPPLEMSTFGIKTITNNFSNKDLSYFNCNIVSVSDARPEAIGKKLIDVCNDFYVGTKNPIIKSGNYWDGMDFQKVVSVVRNHIVKMVN